MSRLVHECRELWADVDAWQTHLLDGACKLTGTSVGAYAESRIHANRREIDTIEETDRGWRDQAARNVRVRMLAEHPNRSAFLPRVVQLAAAALDAPDATVLRPEMRDDDDWYASQMYNEYHRPAFIDGFLMSFVLNRQTGNVIMLQLCQDLSEAAPTRRTKSIVSLLNQQIAPLVGVELSTRRQRGRRGLSPRLQQTLDALLAGDAEKQLAGRLGIRLTTAHEYVGSIYRHFDVRSRGELLGYFIRRRPRH